MKVFVTGATGFVGSAVVKDLIAHGHQVTGLVRSDASAEALIAAGGQPLRGELTDLDILAEGAKGCDGVVHTAFIHDFTRFEENCAIDGRAITALGDALAGSGKPLITTSGTAMLPPGRLNDETVVAPDGLRVSEQACFAFTDKGVRTAAVRLPPSVHGAGDHGFVPMLIAIAKDKGAAAYIGDGGNYWTAVHRFDAAPVYRLILENGQAGGRYHAVAEDGIAFRRIAEAIGKGLGVPVISVDPQDAPAHFNWFARFAALDARATSAWTQETLGWRPTGVGLMEDLLTPAYLGR